MKLHASRLRQWAKRQAQRVRLIYLAQQDLRRFSRTASFSVFDNGYEQVVARIMYNVHALEKGLSRGWDFRPGFGRKRLANLNDALVVYRTSGYDESEFAFIQGLAILQRYREFHASLGANTDALVDLVDPSFLEVEHLDAAGTKVVLKADKKRNFEKSFPELARARSSVREFSGESIYTEQVMNALRYAEKTPSVCNRQGWRVYWTEDKELAARVLRHQRGFSSPTLPEVLLTITVSYNSYLSPVERNQAFVDGGLFSMSVLYGLEHEGLAAVPLNAMMYARDQRAVRELLEIDDSDMISMFIAIGEHMDECVVPVSDRKRAESFVKRR